MARKKTSKVQKVSYAERVLGAMSQIQKEHRKHSIHMATLRAQIRKNADAKHDKLGPNWSSWVGKAVQRLTEDRIIEHPSAQEVAFTPDGKHIITTAKRSVPDEEHLFRHISVGISRGRKRRRSSMGPGQDTGLGSISGKRHRSSSAGGSLNRTPTRRVRKSLGTPAQVTFHDMSPLSSNSEDDDDEASLRTQLRGKEKEIEELRNELNTLSARISNGVYDASVNLTMDDASQIQDTLPISLTLGMVEKATRLHVAKGITRTQSGTYIPNISKQPTPAPSDSGDEDELGRIRGVGGAIHPVPDRVVHASRSPSDLEDQDLEYELNQVDNVDDELTRSRLSDDDERETLLARVGGLERLLEAKDVAFSDLQSAKDSLETRQSSLQQEVSTLQSRLREEGASRELLNLGVQERVNEVAALKQNLLEVESVRDIAQARLSSEEEMRLSLEARLKVVQAELASSRSELAAAIHETEELTTRTGSTTASLEGDLNTVHQRLESSDMHIQQLNQSLVELRADNELQKELYKEARLQLDERTKQVEGLEDELLREKGIRESLEKSLSSTTEKLASVEGHLLGVQTSADEKATCLGETAEKLNSVETTNTYLKGEVDRLKKEVDTLQEALSNAQRLVKRSNEELASKESTLNDLSVKLADAERRVAAAEEVRVATEKRAQDAQQELNRKISGLEEQVAAGKTQTGRLHSMRASLEVQLDQERAALVGVRADALRTEMELEAERSRAAIVGAEKITAEQRARELQEELTRLRDDLNRNAGAVQELEAWVEVFRQNQTDAVDALAGRISSLRSVTHLMETQMETPGSVVAAVEQA